MYSYLIKNGYIYIYIYIYILIYTNEIAYRVITSIKSSIQPIRYITITLIINNVMNNLIQFN